MRADQDKYEMGSPIEEPEGRILFQLKGHDERSSSPHSSVYILLMFLSMLILVLLNIGAAICLCEVLNDKFSGFFIVAGFYIITGLILFLSRENLRKIFSGNVMSKLLDDNS